MKNDRDKRVKKEQSKAPLTSSKNKKFSYCSLPQVPERVFGTHVGPARAAAIHVVEKKWVNGTILHYYFFDKDSDGEDVYFSDGTKEWRTWKGAEEQKAVAREAFDLWKSLGIGLEFKEVNSRNDAEIRIGFMQGDGAWSYIGRDILSEESNYRTTNFGWDLRGDLDTAVHEIGHALGLPHEHQNPNAGIVWDEEAVYASLAEPPNEWPREKTFYNIIRKINADTVQGSNWDPNSIMHYPFESGLIKQPEEYTVGLYPKPGLSKRDKTWVKSFYPPLEEDEQSQLTLGKSEQLAILEGQQRDFEIVPQTTRYYNIGTFGISDTIMVLFEEENGELQYRTADDDSGEEYNARLRVKLIKDHKYVLRVRLYFSDRSGETAVMMWQNSE